MTFNVKDLRALLALCEHMGANIALRFDCAGAPLLAEPHISGHQVSAGLLVPPPPLAFGLYSNSRTWCGVQQPHSGVGSNSRTAALLGHGVVFMHFWYPACSPPPWAVRAMPCHSPGASYC